MDNMEVDSLDGDSLSDEVIVDLTEETATGTEPGTIFGSANGSFSMFYLSELEEKYEKVKNHMTKIWKGLEDPTEDLNAVIKLMEAILDYEEPESPFIPRYKAILGHCMISKGEFLIEKTNLLEGRNLLLSVETSLKPLSDHSDVVYVYLQSLIALGRSFYSDGVPTRALTYYSAAEQTYLAFKGTNKPIKVLPEFMDLIEMQEKWTLESLYYLSQIGIFGCMSKKKDEVQKLEYAVRSFQAKVELALISGKPFTAVQITEKILDFVDVYIEAGFLRQADHLLAVAFYNLLKERRETPQETRKPLDKLLYSISLKYSWFGCQILHKSMKLMDVKAKEKYGVKATKEELARLQVYTKCDRLDKLVGADFSEYENVFPKSYLTNASDTVGVARWVRIWVKRGLNLAEMLKEDRTPFICYMEDVVSIEKVLRATISANPPAHSRVVVLD